VSQSRSARFLRKLVLRTAALWMFYVIACNVILSTGLFARLANQDPNVIQVQYTRAWTVFPGRVHAEGLSIRSADTNIEWMLRVDAVSFDIALWALTHRVLEVSEARAGTCSMRIRQRLAVVPSSPEDYADLPPIEGFGAYSVKTRKPAAEAAKDDSDATYALWTVSIRRAVVASVQEVWIDSKRFEGDAQIDGGFYLKPLRTVYVSPSTWSVRRSSVHIGSRTLASDVWGSGTFALAAFDPRTAGFTEVVHGMTLDANAAGAIPNMRDLKLPLPEKVLMTGATRVTDLSARVRNGVMTDGSRVQIEAPDLRFEFGEHRLEGNVHASAAIADSTLSFNGEILDTAFTLEEKARAVPIARAERVAIHADSHALDLAAPLGDLHMVLSTANAIASDVARFNLYIPKDTPLRFKTGSASVTTQLEAWFPEHSVNGDVLVHSEHLNVELGKLRLGGAVGATILFENYNWKERSAEHVSVHAEVDRGTLATQQAPPTIQASVEGVRFVATAANLRVDDPLESFALKVGVERARFLDATFSGAGDLQIDHHRARGSLSAQSLGLTLKYDTFIATAQLTGSARVRDWDMAHGDLAIESAHLDLRDLRIAEPHAPVAIAIEHVALTARSNAFQFSQPLAMLAISAQAQHGKLYDASAVNAFLAKGSAIQIDAEEGSFEGSLTATLTQGVFDGKAQLKGDAIGIQKDDVHLLGDLSASAEVEQFDWHAKTLKVRDAQLHIAHARARLKEDGPITLLAERIDIQASSPMFDFTKPSLRAVDLAVEVAPTTIADLRAFSEIAWLRPLKPIAGSATLQGSLRLSRAEHGSHALFTLDVKGGEVNLDAVTLHGDATASLVVNGFDSANSVLDLSGSTARVSNISAKCKHWPTEAWRAEAVLHEGSLQLADARVVFRGNAEVRAANARPFFALAFGDTFPKAWLALTSVPRLEAKGSIYVGDGLVAIQNAELHGTNVAMHGTYAKKNRHQRAAFIVERGPFSVGLRLDDQDLRLKLFGLRSWFQDHASTVNLLITEPSTMRDKIDNDQNGNGNTD
jgi:hypothetical protein